MEITWTCSVTILLATVAVLTGGCAGSGSRRAAENLAVNSPTLQTSNASAKHVLVMHTGSMRAPSNITRTKAEAAQRIEQCLARYRQGEKFEDLAREYSDGPSGPRGGDLGEFPHGVMAPAFEQATFACKIGNVTDVVETPFGYHIIYRYN